MTIDEARRALAAWRREGHGVWYITFVVEGYDEEFTMLQPGRLAERVAIGLAREQCAQELHERRKYVHLQSAVKRT